MQRWMQRDAGAGAHAAAHTAVLHTPLLQDSQQPVLVCFVGVLEKYAVLGDSAGVLVFVCFSSCYLLLRRDYDWRILVPIVSHIQTHKREHTIKITNTKRIRVT